MRQAKLRPAKKRTSDARQDADVVVIGAGMAGLSAAVDLTRGGLSVVVLEARPRVGGRVCTLRQPGVALPIELGPEFVHGDAPEVSRLAREVGIALIDVDATHWERRAGRLGRSDGFERSLEHALRAARRTARAGRDVAFAEAVTRARLREPARTRALNYVEGFQAARAGEISTLAVTGEDLGTERLRRVLDGCDQLAERMSERIPSGSVRLNQAVKSVSWDKSGVTVECRSTAGASALRVRGARAIVTLPLGVLASRAGSADAVRFEPGLDAKTRAMSKLAMGNVVRQVLRFDQAFWEERSVVRARKGEPLEQLSFLHADDQDFPTSWTQFPVHAPLLTLWAGGSKADALGALEDEEIVARALASLARALGVPASVPRAHLVEGWRHDWAADPFARGAYSHPLAGGMQAARALAAPVEGTLFFAGEATSDAPDNGTLDGAIASGRRAAREVMRLIAR